MMAISDALYFTPAHHAEIQQTCIRHLNHLISIDKLIPKLSMFKGNTILYKDFVGNPSMPGFIKINLELVALVFGVRIMVYHISEDNYLNASIVNYRFQRTIEIIRTHGNHYDSVHSKRLMESAGFCQNIVLNLIDHAISKNPDKPFQWINFNNDSYLTSGQEAKEDLNRESRRAHRTSHKRSLSDSNNFDTGNIEDNLRIYSMFMNSGPVDDFLHIFKTRDHLPSEDIVIKPTLKMIEEDINGNDYAIPNYPVSNISSGGNSPVGFKENTNFYQQQYLAKAKSAADRPTFETRDDSTITNDKSAFALKKLPSQPTSTSTAGFNPVTFFNQTNPQFSPNRFEQPMYDNGRGQEGFKSEEKVDPLRNLGIIQGGYSPDFNNNPMAGQRVSPYKQGGFSPYGGNQFQSFDPFIAQGMRASPDMMPKRKPIILDEGAQRYTGTLKFFDENKNYGFIIMDDDGSDIFVHYDDLAKANIGKEMLKTARLGNVIRLSFSCMQYIGKYNKSRKATDVEMLIS